MKAAPEAEVPEDGFGHEVRIDGLDIALFQWDQTFYALENLCPHLGFPLTEGAVDDGAVICGWHGWRIRLADGACRTERENARTYPVEIRDGDVYVQIPSSG